MIRLPLLLVAALLAFAAPTAAHSLLLESDPKADATVTAPPARLMLRFNNRIEKRLSRVRILDTHGSAHTLAVAIEDPPVDRLTATVPALGPGLYRVQWQVLSTDGHVVSGFFKFRVVP